MKKIVMAALCAAFACSAQAEEATDQEVLDAVKTSFSGFYFGGGIHMMSLQDELKYEDAAASERSNKLEDSTKTRLGGTILLGVGKKFENIPFYMALEGMLDFAPNTVLRDADKSDSANDGYAGQYSVTMRRNGLIPSVGVRFAWTSDCLQALAYLKVAASFTKDTARYSNYDTNARVKHTTTVKNSKVMPEVTVGIEKRFGKIGMRTEAGYAFGMGSKDVATDGFPNDKLKFKKKGTVVLRMMAVMNINLFK